MAAKDPKWTAIVGHGQKSNQMLQWCAIEMLH